MWQISPAGDFDHGRFAASWDDEVVFRIIRKEVFSPTTFLWEVLAPDVAGASCPGQFVMVRLKEGGERIPLTVADFDRRCGSVTLVVKVVGKTTEEMATYPQGAEVLDCIGPLGNPTRIEKKGHIVLVGGGLGVAPIYPILREFKRIGSRTTTIVGFKTASEVFWKEKLHEFSDRFLLMTEDGSSGRKGTTIEALQEIVSEEVTIHEVLAIGPIGMMKAVAEATRSHGIPTFASMNSIMVDGIGMCGSCRVTVDGQVLFACVDGPDMDAHKVDFEELKVRQNRFRREEQKSLQRYRDECRLKARGVIR